jgi:hypothetical protein
MEEIGAETHALQLVGVLENRLNDDGCYFIFHIFRYFIFCTFKKRAV